jgi:tetratricopeptide (TPR) repeat protein
MGEVYEANDLELRQRVALKTLRPDIALDQREAAEEFRRERATDSEVSAHIVLARSLLAQGKYPAAQEAIDGAKALLNKSENLDAHFSFRITAARVRQASGRPSDRLEAAKSLEAVLGEAKKAGFLGHELEAGLALGEIELQSGNVARARRRLEALERQAAARWFGLIARKAAAARKSMLPSQAPHRH